MNAEHAAPRRQIVRVQGTFRADSEAQRQQDSCLKNVFPFLFVTKSPSDSIDGERRFRCQLSSSKASCFMRLQFSERVSCIHSSESLPHRYRPNMPLEHMADVIKSHLHLNLIKMKPQRIACSTSASLINHAFNASFKIILRVNYFPAFC